MPPEENTNKNTPKPSLDTFKVGIDPVFMGAAGQQKTPADQNITANAYGVLNNQKYTPTTPTVSAIPPDSVTNNNSNQKSIIRTYKGDLESAISANHLSSINIAIAENEKMHSQIQTEPEQATTTEDYSKNKIIIFISLILVVVGIIGISIVYLVKNQNSGTVVQNQILPSLITTEFKSELNIDAITKEKFLTALASKLNDSQITVNNFYNAYITTGTSSAKRLINSVELVPLLNFKMPDIILRSLQPDFMIGTYSFGKNLPFLILKTSSFENTYAGMLTWETNLQKDFGVLFRLPGYDSGGGVLSQLAPTTAQKFEDGVIVNKDVRLLRGTDGQIMFLYGIIDKETIIITVSDTAFKAILDRLNKENGLQR